MPNWLNEFLYVLALSKKTQWALIFGAVFYFGILLLGQHMLSNFELQGSVKGIQDVIAHKIAKKYDKAALVALFSFLVLAYKCYQKDKKRFW
ncbi:hypothetical protein [Vibrio hibernica]|uniref:hypothetical protein n=1 Tax=Vibrio hibernica TaxID=2587465 RepID=UPI001882B141|nr:hypothetical protein [Vibrio hibernica]